METISLDENNKINDNITLLHAINLSDQNTNNTSNNIDNNLDIDDNNSHIDNTYDNKNNDINKYLILFNNIHCIFLNVLLLIIFEIYFYFNYIIIIERNIIYNNINSFIKYIESYTLNDDITNNIINDINKYLQNDDIDNIINNIETYIYNEYKQSIQQRHYEKQQLSIQSYELIIILSVIYSFILLISIYFKKYIEWKKIIISNILLVSIMICFEYYFFNNIVINYNPTSSNEIAYFILCKIYKIDDNCKAKY